MHTIEYRTMNKSDWGVGPWENEPDKKQWQDPVTGLPCLIVRNALGALCGYVGVPSDHPLHGVHYDNVDARVHGGLTFSAGCQHSPNQAHGICHLPSPGEPDDVWWFGFDCAHADDYTPKPTSVLHRFAGSWGYRSFPFVEAEISNLARFLHEARNGTKA